MSDLGSEPRDPSDQPEQPPVPDLGALLSRLGEVQQNLQQAQESAASRLIEGSAGGGAVKIEATGDLEFRRVAIDPSVVDLDDVAMLEDLVLAAIRDVVEQVHAEAAETFGGLGLGGLGGLLGQ
jgi:DNA-binding YbaB/EbfC family protein